MRRPRSRAAASGAERRRAALLRTWSRTGSGPRCRSARWGCARSRSRSAQSGQSLRRARAALGRGQRRRTRRRTPRARGRAGSRGRPRSCRSRRTGARRRDRARRAAAAGRGRPGAARRARRRRRARRSRRVPARCPRRPAGARRASSSKQCSRTSAVNHSCGRAGSAPPSRLAPAGRERRDEAALAVAQAAQHARGVGEERRLVARRERDVGLGLHTRALPLAAQDLQHRDQAHAAGDVRHGGLRALAQPLLGVLDGGARARRRCRPGARARPGPRRACVRSRCVTRCAPP